MTRRAAANGRGGWRTAREPESWGRQIYLHSTFISFDERLFLQREGVCIGSCVAPILCNIFLSQLDRALHNVFNEGGRVLRVFRYVDDFLIMLRPQAGGSYTDQVDTILEVFNLHGKGLSFTHELPTQSTMQF